MIAVKNFRSSLVQTGSIAKACSRITGEKITNADVYRFARNLGYEPVSFHPNTKGFNNLHAQLLRDAIVESNIRIRPQAKTAEVAAAQTSIRDAHKVDAQDEGVTQSGDLAVFSDQDLKAELVRRGWVVMCTREVKTIERL